MFVASAASAFVKACWERFIRSSGSRSDASQRLLISFPTRHDDVFNTILGENNLKFDREEQRRTFYSLRHTYICMRLMEGADVYQIAKNCRTSVKMIENFYASHIKNMVDASVINVRRPKIAPKAKNGAKKRKKTAQILGSHYKCFRFVDVAPLLKQLFLEHAMCLDK
jgi:hypothetical protein